jgi:Transposase and inactivated derivatives
MESDKPATSRRRYSAETKAQVMAECEAPGASVAKVAMAHGINANVVHRWRQLAREDGGEGVQPAPVATADVGGFVPVPLPAPSVVAPVNDIRIELHRGTTTVKVTWPLSAAAECAAWLREVLR